MIRRRLPSIRDEQGIAMVVVVVLFAMLIVLSMTLLATVQSESTRSSNSVVRDSAFQAAEAGIDDYTAKLLDDPLYYLHYVAEGEATRRSSGGIDVSAGSSPTTWGYGNTWTYPSGHDTWRTLSNGYQYSLQVFPPCQAVALPECPAVTTGVRLVAYARKGTTTTNTRKVEVIIRPSSAADFQRLVNGNVSWGSGATTYGKLYSANTIDHDGTAQGDIYAENQITGSVVMVNGAKKYTPSTNPSIRTVIKNPINYSSFLTSLVDIQRAAQVGGVYLDNSNASAWRLVFSNNGTFTASQCSGSNVEDNQPTCPRSGTSTATYNVPSNGAVYVNQTAIVSGGLNAVKGRVTVASNDDIIIAGNIGPMTLGADVLGIDAKENVVTAAWGPTNLTWRAAVIAQNGTWYGAGSTSNHDNMTFYGAAITNDGGSFSGMYETRDYYYDDNLLYLPPPWFPTVGDAYTVVLFREVPPGS